MRTQSQLLVQVPSEPGSVPSYLHREMVKIRDEMNIALSGFHPVVATASLPAAGVAQDGRVIIEDNGAGDRNIIIYAGGQRFRIDGGAAF